MKQYRHNKHILVTKCEGGCHNEVLLSRMVRLKGMLLCDGCYRRNEKEAINEWGALYRRHMNGSGDRIEKMMTAPRLSEYIS